jgi:hypothetical protein
MVETQTSSNQTSWRRMSSGSMMIQPICVFWMDWRHQQVHMAKHYAAGLIQHKIGAVWSFMIHVRRS